MQYSIHFKRTHFLNTAWFILCIAFISVISLRQAGLEWWVIFSISGYSLITVFFFLSAYLFAIFRGVNRNAEPDIEHPVTSLKIYKIVYCLTPMLGFATGAAAQIGLEDVTYIHIITNGTMGTFIITIMAWVIMDPAITILEGYNPASRKSKAERLEKIRKKKQEVRIKREKLLAELAEKEKIEKEKQKTLLEDPADKLSDLIISGIRGSEGARNPEVIDLGVMAWQIGGLKCMMMLRDLAWEKCREKGIPSGIIDEVDYWWDGIGEWRTRSL